MSQPTQLETRGLRKQLRRRRLALSAQDRRQASYHAVRKLRFLAQRFAHRPLTDKSVRVGVFVDAFGELPTQPLIDWAYQQGYSVYLPVVQSMERALSFSKLERLKLQQARLARHRLGMRQPANATQLGVQELDLLFLPLVAFDKVGNRMGMGGGFYDRTLAKARGKPLKIGWAYDFQHVENLHAQPWDVKLDMAVTPSKLWRFTRY